MVMLMFLFMGGISTQAAEYTVTPVNAVLYTGNGAEVFTQPDPSTIAAVFP